MLELYPYQEKVISQLNHQKRCGLYMSVGTGKTITSLTYLQREGIYSGVLVVCPKVLIHQWSEELHRMGFCNYDVVNYERLWRKGYDVPNVKAVILDESQRINGNSKQSKYIMKEFSKSVYGGYLLLLSGTPCAGKYEQLYNQLKILGIVTNKEKYLSAFTIREPIPWISQHAKRVTGYRNIPQLKTLISDRCVFLSQDEALPDLPPLREITPHMTPSMEYIKYLRDRCWDNASEGYHKLRQLSYTPNKHEYITSLLNDGFTGIIFYQYTSTLDKLLTAVTDQHYSILNGQSHTISPDSQLLFIQYQSGSTGLNLQQYHNIIYADVPVNCDTYTQAVARSHRNGQHHPVTLYIPLSTDLDDKVLGHVNTGQDYTIELFDSTY